MLTITGIDELKAKVGEELGVSDWHEVTQAEIDAFADATGDHQWIHVDPERAAQSPFGSTIAHGLYTLGLGPRFTYEAYAVEGFAFGVNYGYDRVRFPAPLPVDSRVRMRATLDERRRRPRRHPDEGHADLRARGRREAGLRRRAAGAVVLGRLRLLQDASSARRSRRGAPGHRGKRERTLRRDEWRVCRA